MCEATILIQRELRDLSVRTRVEVLILIDLADAICDASDANTEVHLSIGTNVMR
jgi:hypothetical protein